MTRVFLDYIFPKCYGQIEVKGRTAQLLKIFKIKDKKMKLKLKKEKLLTFHRTLNSFANATGAKFCYFVNKNIKLLENDVEALNKAITPLPNFVEFDKDRLELVKKHAKKDEKQPDGLGRDPIDPTRYAIKDLKAFDADFEKLKTKHKVAMKEREKQIKEFEELCKEEIEIELHSISKDLIPNTITAQQMNGIFELIEDEEETKKK